MMNPTLAAVHGRVAAEVVHLLGDPTLDWEAFAGFAAEQGAEQVAALATSLATFNTWAQENLMETSLPDPEPAGPTTEQIVKVATTAAAATHAERDRLDQGTNDPGDGARAGT